MRQHETPQQSPREGYPWFRIKAGDSTYHLRIPSIASASSLATYYTGVVIATQGAAQTAQEAAKAVEGVDTLTAAQDATEALQSAQHDMYGALGFVVLSCWRDPDVELVARSAWSQSFAIRKALKSGALLCEFDDAIVEAVRDSLALMREHRTDLKTAFGLLAWEELLDAGLTHEAIQTVGTECARLVFESIKSKDGHGVELIADF